MSNVFHFDPDALHKVAVANTTNYREAHPFPHVVIDDFLPAAVTQAVLDEFPKPAAHRWKAYDDPQEKKLEGTNQPEMGDATRHLFYEFNSSVFIDFLEALTGIEGLVPDPHLHGGGLHQIEPGGFLKIHADFNWHRRLLLDRRLNLLLYLNKDWQDEWGGALELWNRDVTERGRSVLPIFNRCVIFSTTSWAQHGHPDALACPEGMTRKSLALYYYSNGRPAAELEGEHGTEFAPRPGEVWRRPAPSARAWAKRITPPIVWDWAKAARARRSERGTTHGDQP